MLNAGLLFGPESIITTKAVSLDPFKSLAFILYGLNSMTYSVGAIVLVIGLSLLQLSRLRVFFIPDFICWFLVLNINNQVYATLSGGDYLLNQLLLFNCFLSANLVSKKELRHLFHNLASIAIVIQVCLVYFLSGLFKFMDEPWLNGSAVEMINHVNHFSMYKPFELFSGSLFSKITGYLVMTYQLLFPLLVWISRIKKAFLCIGIAMHLYIIFAIGLPTFGIITILSYSYFWPYLKKQ